MWFIYFKMFVKIHLNHGTKLLVHLFTQKIKNIFVNKLKVQQIQKLVLKIQTLFILLP